jgi:hypothetical protein
MRSALLTGQRSWVTRVQYGAVMVEVGDAPLILHV